MMHYYLEDEVAVHNQVKDFWVIIWGNVLDLTPLMLDRLDYWTREMDYFKAFAGKDISHFFHKDGSPRTEISVLTGKQRVLFPPILEISIGEFESTPCVLWSQDPKYRIGRITRRPRQIRVINTLIGTTIIMDVCDEDTIYQIMAKYKKLYNHHAGSYMIRKMEFFPTKKSLPLLMHCTLDQNGLTDPEDTFAYIPPPTIWLYYTDDFTIA